MAWHGTSVLELTYKDAEGHLGNELLYRDREPSLNVVSAGPAWAFDADGGLFRLVSEARRISLAYLFDPLLAVHSSLVQPLPHQITAVYGEMLTRQPLRFLLADDPGSGKTIMAGLLIKELRARGDLDRCLIVCPGSLTEQWQDEMSQRFHLDFDILSRETFETSRTGNPFGERSMVIARLDQLSRNDDYVAKLGATDWDLVVVDEAHKLSATFFSGEVKETKRYKLGKALGALTRNLLLMSATPHNGKEEDFQLFLALLDSDRFEGRFRDGVHQVDASDLMRRLVKEQMFTFEGKPLFPERRAYTLNYKLTKPEAELYAEVTTYVREEMNRADRLAAEGEGKRGVMVGFALTILQRRLASSPEAIWRSLQRRIERLEARLREERLVRRGTAEAMDTTALLPSIDGDLDEFEEDTPSDELETVEEEVVDLASAAKTIAELEFEIVTLKRLEALARTVRNSGTDRKWDELSKLLQSDVLAAKADGSLPKLVIFSEHRDTLNYLAERIATVLGRPQALVTIHGGMVREDRRKAQELFTQDKDVQVLVATDAAGEGINLQRAYLMVNYDLPWNPNRIEQRFGRIHRIGQTEVCHLWNLVADETREGEVFRKLFEKLAVERDALGGRVFDVLGKVFQEQRLRDLLLEAIRYGDDPEVRERLYRKVENAVDHRHLVDLLEERALARDSMDAARVQRIREDMERAEARKLQPHFIGSFFLAAFRLLGGTIHERESKRFEITHVPGVVRARDRLVGVRERVLPRYERITFEKDLVAVPGKPLAAYVCPGHPLLDATIDVIREKYGDVLKRGAVLVDKDDPREEPRLLFYLEHSIQDARTDGKGRRHVVSRRMQFVEIDAKGHLTNAGVAPHLNYEPATAEQLQLCAALRSSPWLTGDVEAQVLAYAVEHVVPEHVADVRGRKLELVDKMVAAVKARLTAEINYWDYRANVLHEKEEAGKAARMNSAKARQRADDLQARLERRLAELEQERRISPLPPVVTGGALILPAGFLARLAGRRTEEPDRFARETERVEHLAMDAVIAAETRLGFEPRDVHKDNCGYDIESRVPGTGKLRFLEVKGRIEGARDVNVTKNEILTALNKPDDFVLAIGIVPIDPTFPAGDVFHVAESVSADAVRLRYVRRPFVKEPDFGVTAVTYELRELLARSEDPS